MDEERKAVSRRASSRFIRVLLLLGLGVLLFGAAFLFVPHSAAAPAQPINFNHQIMVGVGITCQFCHTTVTTSPAAGMPSVEKCMGCHNVVDPTNSEIQKVASFWQSQEPIPWVRVNVLPRFVYFSHEVHVVAGAQNCENCHGDVSHMTVDQPVVRMNMGWCLSCHQKQPNARQLTDCVVCHQ